MKKRFISIIPLILSLALLVACSGPFTATEENMNNEQDQQEMDNLMEKTHPKNTDSNQ